MTNDISLTATPPPVPVSAGSSARTFPDIVGMRNSTFRKGEVLCRESAPGKAVFFLRTGKVKLIRKDRLGSKFLLGLLGPGDTVGLQAVLHNEAYTSTAIALEDTKVSSMDADAFRQWLALHSERLRQVMQMLCTELGRAENRMYAMTRASASARLAEALLMLGKTYGTDADGHLAVRLKPREYADLTNVARGTIYRLLRQFTDEGLIDFDGTNIILLDNSRLLRLAGL